MSISEYKREYNKTYKHTPRFKYNDHKQQAKRRGIEFDMSFEEWWDLWEPHWHERGKTMCMARHNDEGPYKVGNVDIITNSENNRVRNKIINQLRGENGRYIKRV